MHTNASVNKLHFPLTALFCLFNVLFYTFPIRHTVWYCDISLYLFRPHHEKIDI